MMENRKIGIRKGRRVRFPMTGKSLYGFSNVWKNLCAAMRWLSNVWKPTHPTFQHSIIPSRKAGLTLVEVMLAVVILGVGAGVLLTATARCMAVATKAKHYSHAHRLIRRVGAEEPLTRAEIEEGTDEGTFDDADGYSWEREITESEEEDRQGLFTIRTRVSWSHRGKTAFEESMSYIYIPPEELEAIPDRKTKSAVKRTPAGGRRR